MSQYCPHASGLECSQAERKDEFFRQMFDAMAANKEVVYLVNSSCPAWGCECVKLREYNAKQK